MCVFSVERLHDFEVKLLDKPPLEVSPTSPDQAVCYKHHDTLPTNPFSFNCTSYMVGRYLAIVIPGDSEVLTLCEVKVFGYGECGMFIVYKI